MPHPLPVLAAAAPLLALAVHAGSPASTAPHRVLPKNLCESCHGGGQVAASSDASRLRTSDLAAVRYLEAPRRD
ncbi:hypothetical protein [Fulvimonas yonginensis]|uniref:Cytochrome c domain-containing protein n=1 Tax=Fulvimonas yonginensis TaxID=1495200 RepID=A0ABU8JF59_9GAMM